MQGATFTISSLGGIGGTAFTPIVNAPEVAILGVVRSKMAPVWDGKAFAAAPDAAAVSLLRSSRDRRRGGGALHAPSLRRRRGHAARPALKLQPRSLTSAPTHSDQRAADAERTFMASEIRLPDIGDFKDVPIIEIHVKPGQTVAKDEVLLTLESDKATLEVPAPEAGVIGEIKVKVGDKVSQGDLLATYASAAAAPLQPAQRRGSRARRRRRAERRGAGREGRPRMRRAGARRRPRRLHRRLPRRRSRPEGRAGRALADARRRLPQRRLHSLEGAAACRQGDRRGRRIWPRTASPSASPRSTSTAARLQGRRRQAPDRRPHRARHASAR